VGRKAKLKKQRREERRKAIDEVWRYFTSRYFLTQVRKMILDSGASADSCICCTKVLMQIGESLCLNVQPLVVEANVFNPVFAKHVVKHGLNPSEEEMKRLGEAGGRFVVLGAREDREAGANKWPGHLVLLASAKGKSPVVIDLSIDQAHRPKKDILITEPVVFGVPDGFTRGEYCAVGQVGTEVGALCFVYRAFPEDKSYEVSPDWQRDYAAKAHDGVPVDGLPSLTEQPRLLED